ncbi:Oidioi.mRNA.OKI2018_I69.PAR.g9849.t1.cds [Oikopleura dioica]|uniref:chitinase n=1 Tax=Oikopleura dioica TaxID=34765 RepID=A0ABN7RRT8_OIKDI|nr:Oidioi.mRNA.OKI2018_I69.PAR.g9849.t1.cds [Oikopleura dioica]
MKVFIFLFAGEAFARGFLRERRSTDDLNFCESKANNGHYPHCECQKFYHCYENQKTAVKSCTGGTVYDPVIQGCNHAYATDTSHCCMMTTTTTRPPSVSTTKQCTCSTTTTRPPSVSTTTSTRPPNVFSSSTATTRPPTVSSSTITTTRPPSVSTTTSTRPPTVSSSTTRPPSITESTRSESEPCPCMTTTTRPPTISSSTTRPPSVNIDDESMEDKNRAFRMILRILDFLQNWF